MSGGASPLLSVEGLEVSFGDDAPRSAAWI